MEGKQYPAKGSHYAHRTFRLMHKASVAAEIGRDAFCIVAVVLHTEDAARYRGPVTFYNSQLMETLGFAKWDQFNKARQRAVDSGWLAYEGCGKRKPGQYFVTIPDGYNQIDDGMIEDIIPADGYKQGYNDGYKQGVIEGIKRGQSGVQSGYKQGEPSTLTLNPIPNPRESALGESQNPTLEEVTQACQAKGYRSINPTEWWAYWDSIGWCDRNGRAIKWQSRLMADAVSPKPTWKMEAEQAAKRRQGDSIHDIPTLNRAKRQTDGA